MAKTLPEKCCKCAMLSAEQAQAFMKTYLEASGFTAEAAGEDHAAMMEAMMRYMPLRGIVAFSSGKVSEEQLNSFLEEVNK